MCELWEDGYSKGIQEESPTSLDKMYIQGYIAGIVHAGLDKSYADQELVFLKRRKSINPHNSGKSFTIVLPKKD